LWLPDRTILDNLETHCNFRLDCRLVGKVTTTTPKSGDAARRTAPEKVDMPKFEITDYRLDHSASAFEPLVQMSRLTLVTESTGIASDKVQGVARANSVCIDYRLSSFEYRLFPTVIAAD